MTTEMQSFIEALGWALLHVLWQGAAIAAVLAAALFLVRRRSAQLRYALAALALVSLPASFALTFATGWSHARSAVTRSELAPPSPAAASAASEARAETRKPLADATSALTPEPEGIPAQVTLAASVPAPLTVTDRLRPALSWIVGGWVLGVILLSARLLTGWRCLRRLRLSAEVADATWRARFSSLWESMRVSRPVQLLVSAAAPVPMVVGWLKPVVLVPAGLFAGLSAAQLEAVLAHELAHVRRHDYLVNLLQSALETLFFFHPAVWWISGVMRREREHCCDDVAAESCGSRVGYARALAALEELRDPDRTPIGAVAATDGSLLGRVRRLLGVAGREPAGTCSWQASVLVVVLASSLAIGAHFVMGAEGEDPAAPPEPQAHTATRPGTWELHGGVTLEIRQKLVHATDLLTTAVLSWPEWESMPARNVPIHLAADAFANRQPWSVAWEDGKPDLWIATGELRSFRDADRAQPAKATALRRIDFRDPRRIQETYFTGWPADGKPSAGCIAAMSDHLEVNDEGPANGFAIHWATANPAHRMADALRFSLSIDKSGEAFRMNGAESQPLRDLEGALRAEAERRQVRWHEQVRALPPDQREAMEHARPTASVYASPEVPFPVMSRVLEACRAAGVGPEPANDAKQTSTPAPTVRGVDLAGVPQHDDVTTIAELYEADPDHPGNVRKRPDVFFMSLGRVGPWLYVPANANRFYLEVRPDPEVVKDTLYGPIAGDGVERLDLAGWLRDSPHSVDPGYARRVARDMLGCGDRAIARVAISWLAEFEAPSPPDEHDALIAALARQLAEHPGSPVAEEAAAALRHLTTLAEEARTVWDNKRKPLPEEQYQPGKPMDEQLAAIPWGAPAANGLRLGLAGVAPDAQWAIGETVSFEVFVRNDGDEPVKFAWTPRVDEGLRVTLTGFDGREWPASITPFSTLLFHNRCRLDPGHVLKLKPSAEFLVVRANEDGSAPKEPRTHNRILVGAPGKYHLRVEGTIGIHDWSDGEGREIVRPAGEWAGTLGSGALALTVTGEQPAE